MVSLAVLEKHGLTPDSLKAKFTAKSPAPGVKKLLDLLMSRRINAMTQNLSTYRTFMAIDKAYDASFAQTDAIVSQLFQNRAMSTKDAIGLCTQWGLNQDNLFFDWTNPQTGLVEKKLKLKNFYNCLVPLVKAYVTIRRAKIYNDRNTYPLFKYEPIQFTAKDRVKCEVITDKTQRMSSAYGYNQVLNQNILQTLNYGFCLQFIKEPWHTEYQLAPEEKYTVQKDDSLKKLADKYNVTTASIKELNPQIKNEKGRAKLTVGEEITLPERETCVKEGLRYETPHPTRCFCDLASPTNTINTDTGVSFAGYWRVMKYGELMQDENIWNKDAIPFGANNWFWFAGARPFWQELYPCQMTYPTDCSLGGNCFEATQRDRRLLYNISNDYDTPLFVTNMVMKINPKAYGLGTYDYPIWMMFLLANDSTVIWAAPVPYTPITYTGYDADNYRWPNSSMALEILPFQVQLGNILSQILFTAKQGLWKGIFYDNQQLDKDVIRQMENMGDDFSGLRFINYDSQKARVSGNSPKDSFIPIELGAHSSAEMTGQIQVLIDILERLLGMSSAEVGSPASHEQTAQEVRVIASNTSIRVDFTGSFVDDMIKAWKNQLYYAQMAYGDDEYESQVNPTPETLAVLKEMGFDVPEDTQAQPYDNGRDKLPIKVQKSKMVLDGFASERDGANRIDNPAVAAVILQGVMAVSNNPMLAQSVGSQAILDLMTQAMLLAGAPRDFKLRVDPKAGPEAQQQQMQAQLEPMAKQIMEQVLQQVGEGIKPLAEALKQDQAQIQQLSPMVQQIMQKLAEYEKALQAIAQQGQQGMQQLAQETQQTQAALKQVAGATAATAQEVQAVKQEADATAQAVVQLSHSTDQLHAATNPMGAGGVQTEPPMPPGGLPVG